MIITRMGVFETNSSGTHSLILDLSTGYVIDITDITENELNKGVIEVPEIEFDSSYNLYNGFKEKLAYALLSSTCLSDVREIRHKLIKDLVYEITGLALDESVVYDGNIDSEAKPYDENDESHINYLFSNVEIMKVFLFSNKSYICTDRDYNSEESFMVEALKLSNILYIDNTGEIYTKEEMECRV